MPMDESEKGSSARVIIVVGPTGVGKTSLSVAIAKALRTEVISADSMQVYRGMDIGTAKPSADEREGVTHHLIDILSPGESFSVGMFRNMATDIIQGLHRRGKIPVVVGGTGLYIKSLTQGLCEGPSADWSLREALEERERFFGKGHLHRLLGSIDPSAAGKISQNDTRRAIRALEVAVKGGRTISEIQKESTAGQSYGFIKIGLFRERKELYRLIEERVDRMIDRGLVRETEHLLKGEPEKTAFQALGYKEMARYLNGSLDREGAVKLLKKRTKMYAKRQYTWFRKEPDIHWVDITHLDDKGRIFRTVIDNVEILRELLYFKETPDGR